jgi:hypothetical protein
MEREGSHIWKMGMPSPFRVAKWAWATSGLFREVYFVFQSG